MKTVSLGSIIFDLEGLTLTPEDKEILLHPQIGGVIFFRRHYENPKQLAELVREIRSIRPHLLLCVDQEGGRVQRFVEGLTQLPPLRLLGNWFDAGLSLSSLLDLSKKCGQLMALEVRSLGVDLSFAPVLDLDRGISQVIGDRAFHSDPKVVCALANAYIKGMAEVGMAATGKHFPGHGAVALDSHLALPADARKWEAVEKDLMPFQYLMKEGIAAIMPAHIVYPHMDPLPVGFSSFWLQTILRQRCRFQGAIVSDDLSMEGANKIGDFAQRAKKAIEAGCDFILICNNRHGVVMALKALASYRADEATLARRVSLLATQDAVPWERLKENGMWQVAKEAVDQLMEARCH